MKEQKEMHELKLKEKQMKAFESEQRKKLEIEGKLKNTEDKLKQF